ncbi:MAG: hypothetical protein ACM3SS_18610 [Rhodospirillaceae bacterium]
MNISPALKSFCDLILELIYASPALNWAQIQATAVCRRPPLRESELFVKPALTFCFSSAFFALRGGQIRGEELCHHIFVLSRFFVRFSSSRRSVNLPRWPHVCFVKSDAPFKGGIGAPQEGMIGGQNKAVEAARSRHLCNGNHAKPHLAAGSWRSVLY